MERSDSIFSRTKSIGRDTALAGEDQGVGPGSPAPEGMPSDALLDRQTGVVRVSVCSVEAMSLLQYAVKIQRH